MSKVTVLLSGPIDFVLDIILPSVSDVISVILQQITDPEVESAAESVLVLEVDTQPVVTSPRRKKRDEDDSNLQFSNSGNEELWE